MQEDEYRTIKAAVAGRYQEKGSRFFSMACPVHDEGEVKINLHQARKSHPRATHHCYAFRLATIPPVYRASDDREPKGSASRPLLNALSRFGLTNVLVVVSRYFGGQQLGLPALTRAYQKAAESALEKAETVIHYHTDLLEITAPLPHVNALHALIRSHGGTVVDSDYGLQCRMHVQLHRSLAGPFVSALQNHPVLHGCMVSRPGRP